MWASQFLNTDQVNSNSIFKMFIALVLLSSQSLNTDQVNANFLLDAFFFLRGIVRESQSLNTDQVNANENAQEHDGWVYVEVSIPQYGSGQFQSWIIWCGITRETAKSQSLTPAQACEEPLPITAPRTSRSRHLCSAPTPM